MACIFTTGLRGFFASVCGFTGNRCTMCYRCISACPAKAITLLGDVVVEQCGYDRYMEE